MGFIVTGQVRENRKSTNKDSGEVSFYARVIDMGQDVTVRLAPQWGQSLQPGTQVQVPCEVRATSFNGQARLSITAIDAPRTVGAGGGR